MTDTSRERCIAVVEAARNYGRDEEAELILALMEERNMLRLCIADKNTDISAMGKGRQKREQQSAAVREALRVLYEETASYITINNLGPVHHNRSMQMARDALAQKAEG